MTIIYKSVSVKFLSIKKVLVLMSSNIKMINVWIKKKSNVTYNLKKDSGDTNVIYSKEKWKEEAIRK